MNILSLVRPLFVSGNAPRVATQSALAVLRVIAGVVMIHNGLDKLGDIEGFAEAYVEVIGLPFPIFFSYVAGLTELLGAPLLALGLFTRPAALGLTSTMLVAVYHHILVAGISIPFLELSVLYGGVFAFFTVNGAGDYSLDTLIAKVFGWTVKVDEPVVASSAQVESLEASLKVPAASEKVTGWGSYLTK
jgi:putative oxidoreductase